MDKPLRVIGFDPGLRATGWGVIGYAGSQLHYVASGTVAPTPDKDLAQRLLDLDTGLDSILQRYQPDIAAIEDCFVSCNSATSLKLGQASAISLLVCARLGLCVHHYAPTHVKKALTSNGRAPKAQLQHMLRLLLPRAQPTNSHEVDALGVAITHAHGFARPHIATPYRRPRKQRSAQLAS